MRIKSLQLNNFRNYEELNVEFNSNKILLIGKNAQGKTNILEAIYYLSNLRPLNAKNDTEIMQWDKTTTTLKATIEKNELETSLDVIINPPRKKVLKIDGVKKSKFSEFISNFAVVSFTVNDLLLLRGAPDDRRDWLDIAISQIYPAYSDRIIKYNKIRIQKNNYLKSLKFSSDLDENILFVWNTQLVTTGSNIVYLRTKFLKELQKIATLKHTEISQNEEMNILYNSTVIGDFNSKNDELLSVEEIAHIFKKKIEEKMQEELIRAQTLVGPHRDDISYFINNVDSKKFASQGQQRTIVLSLKLAELALIKKQYNYAPVLLLDDVLAELDDLRQNYLLNAIDNKTQTIITSVDTLHFDTKYLKDVEIFNILNGRIV